ncbi:MAG TPA: hypothetical protein DCY13_18210 [Verrucomicrobiales bacterium]|nr:hypothetical protein [Verrucomicrobiales bacterium]
MKILTQARDLPHAPRRVCLAIGVFDGVHLGHQQVIRQAIHDASHLEAASVVVTFDRHPNHVVAPHAVPPAIHSLEEKLGAMDRLGVEATLVIPFDVELSRQPARDFIGALAAGFGNIRAVCVGREFTFGHKRQGDVSLLESMGAEMGFRTHGLAAVSLDGQVVSSTRIREFIQNGDLDAASQMLGRDYTLTGTVVRGDQLGTRIGFPTANLAVNGLVTPPTGVYAVHAFHRGTPLRGVVNIGRRPTVSDHAPDLRVEVHLLDYSGSLYGQKLSLQFLRRLRDEQRFDSVESLAQQIAKDVAAARDAF